MPPLFILRFKLDKYRNNKLLFFYNIDARHTIMIKIFQRFISKLITNTLTIAFSLAIVSCGGGGGDTPASTTPTNTIDQFRTTISTNLQTLTADGTSTATITVQAVDTSGNNMTSGGDAIALATSLGTLSIVTDNQDGTYNATLTSSSQQGLAIVTGTITGNSISDHAGIANRIDQADPDFIALAALGKKLFEDTNLSEPVGQSCASCHDSTMGFDDPDFGDPTSLGADNASIGTRNAQMTSYAAHIPQIQRISDGRDTLIGGQFWDGRAATLEEQSKQPFLNPVEMNNANEAAVITKIKAATYMAEFESIFGASSLDNVTTAYDQMAQAIAAFQRTTPFSRFTSKFDAVKAGTDTFTQSEAMGEFIFFNVALCSRCHSTTADRGDKQVFSNFEYFNIGVPSNPLLFQPTDNGLGVESGSASDNGKFRTPSLRNIAETGPYMHNGVFTTLAEVIQFYSTGITGGVLPEVNSTAEVQYTFGLTPNQEVALEAFLRTLSDQ